MNLQQYFDRIGYVGPTLPNLQLLTDIHRHHICAIAYENIDVILEHPVTQDPADIFQKIVLNGRGGWCYEMNGLLGWALNELGFEVSRVCGGVMRAMVGDDAFGNHLVLIVRLGGVDYIADAGLGDGLINPIELREGVHEQFDRSFRLELLNSEPSTWRFHNRTGGTPPSFDFFSDDSVEQRLALSCQTLQSNPESMFRQNLICQRISETGGAMLLGRVLRYFDPNAPRQLLSSEAELTDTLADIFGIQTPPLGNLWQIVSDRHQELFADTPVDKITFGPPPAADTAGR
jgi:N-hydroxyarylamine O-acetyltransferase